MKKLDIVEFKDKTPGSTGLSHENLYIYLGEACMKDSSKNWVDAVMYADKENPEKIYIREKEDFIRKFKKASGSDQPKSL